jgi:hypothetical protein
LRLLADKLVEEPEKYLKWSIVADIEAVLDDFPDGLEMGEIPI